ncbi:MAG: SDR family oxidoreductase [Planctomycetia bacterium]
MAGSKWAVVTGAGTGVGRAVARELAAAGWLVAAVGRRVDKLNETAAGAPIGSVVRPLPFDVSDRTAVASVMDAFLCEVGSVGLLVNNAGVNVRRRKMAELSVADWDYLVQVNLTGAFQMMQAVLPGMRAAGGGVIVNISSVAGLRPSPLGGAAYSASKFGLNGLSGTVALEEAANGVRCSVVCPGEINTPILDDRPEPVSEERRAAMLQPADVAAAVLFLASLPPHVHVPELVIKPLNQPFA